MGSSKRLKISKYLSRAFDSTSERNIAQGPSGSSASGWSDPSFGEEAPQQAALLRPTKAHSSHFMGKHKSRSRSPSPSPPWSSRVDRRIATPVSQSLISAGVLARPHSSYSETPTRQTYGPFSSNVSVVPSGDHSSPSFRSKPASLVANPDPQGGRGNPAPLSTCVSHNPTSSSQAQVLATVNVYAAVLPEMQSTTVPDMIEPSPSSAMVWAKTLEIVEKKLRDNNLPHSIL